jgi:hypothetical protein
MKILSLTLLLVLTSCALTDIKEQRTQNSKSNRDDDFVVCKSRCENGSTQVFEYNPQTDKCVLKFSYSCFPNACDRDKITCRAECSSDRDCSFGSQCFSLERRCVPKGQYTCHDNYTKVDGVGNQGSCVPYRCNLGQCMNSCISGSDCAKGFYCDKNVCVLQ